LRVVAVIGVAIDLRDREGRVVCFCPTGEQRRYAQEADDLEESHDMIMGARLLEELFGQTTALSNDTDAL
jgi:hypothetical protein